MPIDSHMSGPSLSVLRLSAEPSVKARVARRGKGAHRQLSIRLPPFPASVPVTKRPLQCSTLHQGDANVRNERPARVVPAHATPAALRGPCRRARRDRRNRGRGARVQRRGGGRGRGVRGTARRRRHHQHPPGARPHPRQGRRAPAHVRGAPRARDRLQPRARRLHAHRGLLAGDLRRERHRGRGGSDGLRRRPCVQGPKRGAGGGALLRRRGDEPGGAARILQPRSAARPSGGVRVREQRDRSHVHGRGDDPGRSGAPGGELRAALVLGGRYGRARGARSSHDGGGAGPGRRGAELHRVPYRALLGAQHRGRRAPPGVAQRDVHGSGEAPRPDRAPRGRAGPRTRMAPGRADRDRRRCRTGARCRGRVRARQPRPDAKTALDFMYASTYPDFPARGWES